MKYIRIFNDNSFSISSGQVIINYCHILMENNLTDKNSAPSIFVSNVWFFRIFMILCFVAAFGIRIYDITDLPLDFHPTRQLQSLIKSRGMFLEQTAGVPDWQRQTAVRQWKAMPVEEPEIVEKLAVFAYQLAGGEYIWLPRLFSILFWLVGGIGLLFLARSLIGVDGAVIATCFYLFLPYGVYASRAFMPDPLMVMFIIWGIWATNRWYNHPSWMNAILAGILCGLAILVKLTAIFMIAGGAAGLLFGNRSPKQVLGDLQVWVFGLLALLPAVIYNLMGIYFLGFISQGSVVQRILLSLLIDPLSYLRWYNKIEEVLGISALLLAIAGTFLIAKRSGRSLVIGLWAGYVLFGVFFMYYYGTHNYYHLPLIPLVALGIAPLGQLLIQQLRLKWPGWPSNAFIVLLLVLAIFQNIWVVRTTFKRIDYRPEATFWQEIGDKLRGSSVLALTQDYNGRLAYWGWFDSVYFPTLGDFQHQEITGHEINVLKYFEDVSAGKDFFLVTRMDELDAQPEFKAALMQKYPVYSQGTGYIIFDLRNPE